MIYPKDTERYPPFEQLEPDPDPQNNQIPGETIPLEIKVCQPLTYSLTIPPTTSVSKKSFPPINRKKKKCLLDEWFSPNVTSPRVF